MLSRAEDGGRIFTDCAVVNSSTLLNRLVVVSSKLSLISRDLRTQRVNAERRFEALFKGIVVVATMMSLLLLMRDIGYLMVKASR